MKILRDFEKIEDESHFLNDCTYAANELSLAMRFAQLGQQGQMLDRPSSLEELTMIWW